MRVPASARGRPCCWVGASESRTPGAPTCLCCAGNPGQAPSSCVPKSLRLQPNPSESHDVECSREGTVTSHETPMTSHGEESSKVSLRLLTFTAAREPAHKPSSRVRTLPQSSTVPQTRGAVLPHDPDESLGPRGSPWLRKNRAMGSSTRARATSPHSRACRAFRQDSVRYRKEGSCRQSTSSTSTASTRHCRDAETQLAGSRAGGPPAPPGTYGFLQVRVPLPQGSWGRKKGTRSPVSIKTVTERHPVLEARGESGKQAGSGGTGSAPHPRRHLVGWGQVLPPAQQPRV